MNELSRQVAELRGWRVVLLDNKAAKHILRPDGTTRAVFEPDHSDELIWQLLTENDCRFAKNTDLALTLTVAGYKLHLMQIIDGWRAYYVPVYSDGEVTLYGKRIDETEYDNESPAIAICESYVRLCELEAVKK